MSTMFLLRVSSVKNVQNERNISVYVIFHVRLFSILMRYSIKFNYLSTEESEYLRAVFYELKKYAYTAISYFVCLKFQRLTLLVIVISNF